MQVRKRAQVGEGVGGAERREGEHARVEGQALAVLGRGAAIHGAHDDVAAQQASGHLLVTERKSSATARERAAQRSAHMHSSQGSNLAPAAASRACREHAHEQVSLWRPLLLLMHAESVHTQSKQGSRTRRRWTRRGCPPRPGARPQGGCWRESVQARLSRPACRHAAGR
jgi:hypothetical protein